jgi:exodeoxyribonuclease VII small subunit
MLMAEKKSGTKTGRKENKATFEKSLERLEAIVSEMEDGSLGLEEMINRFEEGQILLKSCSQKLNEVERKIEILVKKGDKTVAAPFGQEDCSNDGDDSSESDAPELF